MTPTPAPDPAAVCKQRIAIHEPTSVWYAPRDVTTDYCWENPLTGNFSNVGRHMPLEEK